MLRWHIVRTLLYKEVLRYRYNWGLLVVVAALLGLSGLVALSSRFSKLLPGQAGSEIQTCRIVYGDRPLSKEWADYLRKHPPRAFQVEYDERPHGSPLQPLVRDGELLITLGVPPGSSEGGVFPSQGWKIRYWCKDETAPGTMALRDWVESATADFVGATPRIAIETKEGLVPAGTEKVEVTSTIVTAFSIFALYLLSFHLFVTSTGEEREKKVLLGLLLSPAAAHEVLFAKAIFYGAGSMGVSLAVVGMFNPALLLRPLLWLTVACGSLAYIAIGTVVISVVRRQTTINTVSMLYLLVTTIIMMLSQVLRPFIFVKAFLVENYLYAQMKQLVAGQWQSWMIFTQAALFIGTIAWCGIAVWVFARRATSIAQAR